jgi:hypothetical protein
MNTNNNVMSEMERVRGGGTQHNGAYSFSFSSFSSSAHFIASVLYFFFLSFSLFRRLNAPCKCFAFLCLSVGLAKRRGN